MGEAIGQSLSLAVGVALSPVPIIAVILMLVTPRARSNGPAFIAGWLLGLALIGVIVLGVIGPSAHDDGEAASWVGWVKLVARRRPPATRGEAVARPAARRRGAAGSEVDGGNRQLHAR